MITWGISANSHDASLAVFDSSSSSLDLRLQFASHSERFSGVKNDAHLNKKLLDYALQWGRPSEVIWYEKPFKKTLRQLYAGQGWLAKENNIKQYLKNYGINAPLGYSNHHESHAAAGYYTSGFTDATILCIDSIGEFETLTIWEGKGNNITKRFSQGYPHSVGLFYSAMTQRVGLKPNEDEYILMGMSAYGDPKLYYDELMQTFIEMHRWSPDIRFKHNLHKGCMWWRPEINKWEDHINIAAATQEIYATIFKHLVDYCRTNFESNNIVIMGGCALNCVANDYAEDIYQNTWIMPNPSDAGSSVGAVLAKKQMHIDWKGPYLGYNIDREYPVEQLLKELETNQIVGVANGKAEFGPRALGNRSLLADPRGADIKDKVNTIKKRQMYRPFAPAILEEHAEKYFYGSVGPYMQYTSKCKEKEQFPAIVHVDGTSRVQTVSKNDNSGFRELLEKWYEKTGCPMLLNTSLNIKGKPMINDENDIEMFCKKYKVSVY